MPIITINESRTTFYSTNEIASSDWSNKFYIYLPFNSLKILLMPIQIKNVPLAVTVLTVFDGHCRSGILGQLGRGLSGPGLPAVGSSYHKVFKISPL